jgi:Xaa-Pro aminopeptidase
MRRTLARVAGVTIPALGLLALGLLATVATPHVVGAQPRAVLDPWPARRDSAFRRVGHGVLIVTSAARPRESGVRQAADFHYLTGLESLLGGVLVLDGPAREARLFYPARLPGFAGRVAAIEPGRQDTAGLAGLGRAGLAQVAEWGALAPYLEGRLAADPTLRVYLDAFDDAQPTVGTPFDTARDDVPRRWREMLARRWPGAEIVDGAPLTGALRMVKDSGEIRALRRAGALSAAAFLAGVRAIRPGVRQRAVEGAVVGACMQAGGEGPSFWPWAMSGPNAGHPRPWKGDHDAHHLDRAMAAGDLVRLDVGCEVTHYMGDVGRTVPASGRYDAGQRETWDVLVSAYRAGLRTIRAGARGADVIAASVREVERRRGTLRSALAREAAAAILGGPPRAWQLHGVGLEAAEPLADTLRAGMVLAYEPTFTVRGQGFYLEDMLLVTPTGYELLTPGLPYTAAEVERVMRAPRLAGR